MSTPNYPLALALASTSWGNSETARRINARAQREGHRSVAVDRSRVGRWIRQGEKPRPPVPTLLAELLTEHLGQPYTPESLGLAPGRRVRVLLEAAEHEALVAVAAAANVSVEEYVRALLRSALSPYKGATSPYKGAT
ncbi:hypothetical protein GCM10010094_93430 [Streptomyces flaveus]|uniref:Uncharacterized protein n=1 Tax=Streptomyces flaveus TaxID=66370 RepID=A0A917RQF2_9ACTN|nr:hypothetical protein GCM10010094_93430 [Streptomyces flaveus]